MQENPRTLGATRVPLLPSLDGRRSRSQGAGSGCARAPSSPGAAGEGPGDAGHGTRGPPRPTRTAFLVCWGRRDLRGSCERSAAVLSPSPGGGIAWLSLS